MLNILQQIIKQNNLKDFDDAKVAPFKYRIRKLNLIVAYNKLSSKPSPPIIIK